MLLPEPGLLVENNRNFNFTGLLSLEKVIVKEKPTTTTTTTTTVEEETTSKGEDDFVPNAGTTSHTETKNLQGWTQKPTKKANSILLKKKNIAKKLIKSASKAVDEEQKMLKFSQKKDDGIIWLGILFVCCR